jgi:hypothetical protein
MAINITEDCMSAEIDGSLIATAFRTAGGRWTVSTWPCALTRNGAITALTLAERLADDDVFVTAWREELRSDRPAHQD